MGRDITATIPRALVAEALGVDPAGLPPGDLPLDRFAARFLAFLAATDASDSPDAHPDFWTYALFEALAADHPALCLAAIRASLAAADSPEQVALIAAGPLEDLLRAHGTTLIGEVEALAARAPRFAYALTGVWPPEQGQPMLWARLKALADTGPQIDAGDALPSAGGLA
jgi:Family of unknown function (DUF6869)